MTATLWTTAVVILPGCFWLLYGVMCELEVPRRPTLPFFFVFGTVGGWLLAFALSPSGLAANCVVFLVTAAPLALLSSSVYLAVRSERTLFHRVAMWSGFGYPVALGLMFLLIYFLRPFFFLGGLGDQ